MHTTQIATSLFTRQQLGEITGLDNHTMNYWGRENLLLAEEGGAGRGSHKRFDFIQANIAALLGALWQFRLGIKVMKSFAGMLQEAAQLGKLVKLHPGSYSEAAALADTLHRFRCGEAVMIRAHAIDTEPPAGLSRSKRLEWSMAKRQAMSEEEVITDRFPRLRPYDFDPPEDVIAAAELIGPGKFTIAELYFYLVTDILVPGYCDAFSWLVGWGPDGSLRVEFGTEGAKFFDRVTVSAAEAAESFGPGIFIPASGIIRKMWGPRGYDAAMIEYRQSRERRRGEYEVERIQKILAAAEITAAVTPSADGDGYSVESETPWSEIERALRKGGYPLGSREDTGEQSQ